MDGCGIKDLHKCGEEMSKNSSLPSREQQETSELNGSGGGRGKGIRGAKALCPGRRHQPGQNGGLLSRLVVPTGTKGPRTLLFRLEPPTGTKGPHFVPVGVSNRDKRPWPHIPFPLPPPEPFSSLVSCCSRLGREEFLLISSPHL